MTAHGIARGLYAAVLLAGLSACANTDLEKRMSALEERLDEAMRASATAKIDATTALKVANEKR